VRDNYDHWPSSGPEEDDGIAGDEPDEISVDDVSRRTIEEIDRDLIENGKISPETRASDEYMLEQEVDAPEANEALEAFAESLRDPLGDAGLLDADLITAENLKKIPPETLRQLTPQTAEFLYFRTLRRNRKWLGGQPVGLNKWLSQANVLVRHGANIENMMLNSRAKNLGELYETGIDPYQLVQLSSGSPEIQQTIDRLYFFLFDEPRLEEYVKSLTRDAEIEGPYEIESVVINGQDILKKALEAMEDGRAKDKIRGWVDLIYEEKYENTAHRIGSAITISNKILEALRGTTTYDDFIRRTEQ